MRQPRRLALEVYLYLLYFNTINIVLITQNQQATIPRTEIFSHFFRKYLKISATIPILTALSRTNSAS